MWGCHSVDAGLLVLASGWAVKACIDDSGSGGRKVIRFRELNAQKAWENGTIGIDDVTEYFFVGSFASWIVALAG
jgi:hypothetical protein